MGEGSLSSSLTSKQDNERLPGQRPPGVFYLCALIVGISDWRGGGGDRGGGETTPQSPTLSPSVFLSSSFYTRFLHP